jgi:cytochrome P450
LVEFDPYSYGVHEDPYPVYRQLRAEAPVYRNAELGFVALSRHADVLAGFRDARRLSNRHGVSLDPDAFHDRAHTTMSFLGMDPPRQTRMRALVSRGFTPRRVAALEPRVREIALLHLGAIRDAGRCDFIADFAGRLPMDVISELVGVPEADRAQLRTWADLVVHREEGVKGIPPATVQSALSLVQYFQKMLAARRSTSGDDLTAALIEAEIDGDRLTDEEIVGFLFLMIIAGNETTTKLLGNALYWLEKNPDQRRLVRADPALIPAWAEETLRYDNSSQALARLALEDVELPDGKIQAGEKVVLLIGSANRDERVFPEPDRFDIERDTSASLSFGQGNHFCLGASLARMEARVALEEVLRVMPDYEIEHSGIARVHSVNVRGFAALPVSF